MISLEQVQLLETRVAKAIEYVQRVSEENASLISEKAGLLSKLEANQKRLDELELLVMRFKKEQGQIEDGIVAALDRLNQFEEEFEEGLKEKSLPKKSAPVKKAEPAAEPPAAEPLAAGQLAAKAPPPPKAHPQSADHNGGSGAGGRPAEKVSAQSQKPPAAASRTQNDSKEFFEITETEDDDIEKELSSDFSESDADGDSDDKELDIF